MLRKAWPCAQIERDAHCRNGNDAEFISDGKGKGAQTTSYFMGQKNLRVVDMYLKTYYENMNW